MSGLAAGLVGLGDGRAAGDLADVDACQTGALLAIGREPTTLPLAAAVGYEAPTAPTTIAVALVLAAGLLPPITGAGARPTAVAKPVGFGPLAALPVPRCCAEQVAVVRLRGPVVRRKAAQALLAAVPRLGIATSSQGPVLVLGRRLVQGRKEGRRKAPAYSVRLPFRRRRSGAVLGALDPRTVEVSRVRTTEAPLRCSGGQVSRSGRVSGRVGSS